jgi:DNA-binding MarR family transcriptional regulator/predicted GNAT family N-acyltransferase
MDSELTAQVRSFHRSVTQRAGVLSADYLDRSRPLGASRVLWEIGPDGTDARELRARLDLDSGYLSRLLRGLQDEGLVQVRPAPGDHRVRTVGLTAAGRAERAELDRRSDELAWSLLAPLTTRQRGQLTEAMATVQRLLNAGQVQIGPADPASPEARFCLRSYFAELAGRFEAGFDPAASLPATDQDLAGPSGLLLVARLHGEPVGCGALKLHGTGPAEIKRMWIADRARGLGLGRRLLAELEDRARARGASAARLETNRALAEAISLYRSAGYTEVAPFSDEPYAHHWFTKPLTDRRRQR